MSLSEWIVNLERILPKNIKKKCNLIFHSWVSLVSLFFYSLDFFIFLIKWWCVRQKNVLFFGMMMKNTLYILFNSFNDSLEKMINCRAPLCLADKWCLLLYLLLLMPACSKFLIFAAKLKSRKKKAEWNLHD